MSLARYAGSVGRINAMTAANVHRREDRSAAVLLRFSHEDREEVKRLAREAGMTVQDFAELRLLGREPAPRSGGRPARPADKGLFDMTG